VTAERGSRLALIPVAKGCVVRSVTTSGPLTTSLSIRAAISNAPHDVCFVAGY
jgi:hypothetical protein